MNTLRSFASFGAIPVGSSRVLTAALAALFCALTPVSAFADDFQPTPYPTALSAGKDKISAAVQAENEDTTHGIADCVNENAEHYWNQTPKILLDTTSVYSYVVSVEAYCGGLHENDYEAASTFDATTGSPYSVFSMYRIGTPIGTRGGRLLSEVYVDAVNAILKAKAFPNDASCIQIIHDDRGHDSGESPIDKADFTLGGDGIHVYLRPNKAEESCYPDIVLPYASLARYLNVGEAARLGFVGPSALGVLSASQAQ
jgi:pterin-4a-carbinolamine dehydratase